MPHIEGDINLNVKGAFKGLGALTIFHDKEDQLTRLGFKKKFSLIGSKFVQNRVKVKIELVHHDSIHYKITFPSSQESLATEARAVIVNPSAEEKSTRADQAHSEKWLARLRKKNK